MKSRISLGLDILGEEYIYFGDKWPLSRFRSSLSPRFGDLNDENGEALRSIS